MQLRLAKPAFISRYNIRTLSSLSGTSNTGLSQFGGVHGNKIGSGASKAWRNKPLFRRDGDKIFKTGTEACQMLIQEANRRDSVSKLTIYNFYTYSVKCH